MLWVVYLVLLELPIHQQCGLFVNFLSDGVSHGIVWLQASVETCVTVLIVNILLGVSGGRREDNFFFLKKQKKTTSMQKYRGQYKLSDVGIFVLLHHDLSCHFKSYQKPIYCQQNLTRWCAGRPLQILLHCQGQGSSSQSELMRAEAAPLPPPDKQKKRGKKTICKNFQRTILVWWSAHCDLYLLFLLLLVWATVFTVWTWRYFISAMDHYVLDTVF